MRHRVLHYICVFLLLFAQQSAISHAAWHAGGGAHGGQVAEMAHAPDASESIPGAIENLCDFDLAFGQVMGGAHAAALPALFAPAVAENHPDLPASILRAEALSPKSRGPPVFL